MIKFPSEGLLRDAAWGCLVAEFEFGVVVSMSML